MPFRVAVLASGQGSNLQAVIDRLHGRGAVEIVGVASDRATCRALERAAAAGIATASFPLEQAQSDRAGDLARARVRRDLALAAWIEEREASLVVLAGFMQLLSSEFIERFRGRVINVHPALLPAFPGLDAIDQAIEHGVKVTGVTVHFVDEGVDSGPIILQQAVPIAYPAQRMAIENEIHAVEHRLLPDAIELIAAGRVRPAAGDQRAVVVVDDAPATAAEVGR